MNLRSLIPTPLKRRFREAHRAFLYRWAIRNVEKCLRFGLPVSFKATERLMYGWSNEGWSAKPALISYLFNDLRGFSGLALECGSGLSTIALALIARQTGARVLSLEHDKTWHGFLGRRLASLGLATEGLLFAPLKDFKDYRWYDLDRRELRSHRIGLVICDGPPNDTRGGRYGLLPQTSESLAHGALIIVDDTHRPAESGMVQRWLQEYGGQLSVLQTFETFSVLRFEHTESDHSE
jgi:hypothetical protein